MISQIHKEPIWEYFSITQKDLIDEGDYLTSITEDHGYRFKDYSFLVFPYAKAYEGYLKQLFLDLNFMSHLDYISDHFRIGKYLSPHLMNRLGERSIYTQIVNHSSEEIAAKIWEVWKNGRNEVFHYYPHNIKRLTFDGAKTLNEEILSTMIEAYEKLKLNEKINGIVRE